MELNAYRANEVLEPVAVQYCPDSPRSASPAPVLSTNACCDLEDILSDAITESLQTSLRLNHSQLINQELTIRPEANIEQNVPDGLDLYRVIFEVESDNEPEMAEDGVAVQNHPLQEPESCRLVGGSKFYQVMEGAASGDACTPSPTEKHDHMKPTDSEDEDVDQECTVFSGVSYLGAQNIADPKSETDIQRIMKELSSMPESRDGIAVSISIPVCSQGLVVLYQADTNVVMTRYSVKHILFYARGTAGSPVASCFAFTWSHGETKESAVYRCHVFRCHIAEAVSQVSTTYSVKHILFYARGTAGSPVASCFAFTWSHGETKESAVYRCHVFRCHIAEAVSQVSTCFAKAFERTLPRSMASSVVGELSAAPSMTGSLTDNLPPCAPPMQLMHVLEVTVEIKETDAKGTYSHVPKERLGFKLRGGIDKQVTINVQQVTSSSQPTQLEGDEFQVPYGGLYIERCFGILLAPARGVKHPDMRLLEMVSGSSGVSGCSGCALWNAGDSALAAFNVASNDGAPSYMSIALDLVIRGIPDPLRLVIETPVKIYPPTERFWYYSKRPLVQQFIINLKETVDAQGMLQYEVANVETSGEFDRSRLNLPLLSSLLPSPLSNAPAPPSPLDDSDGDEPMLSGTGDVSKDCGEEVLENWANVLRSWTGPRPKALDNLVRTKGVPEALRGEVWLRLAQVEQSDKLMDTYRMLISQECEEEAVIQRDIARTFPAHDFFREAGGLGQDSLLRLGRAYAIYDSEVRYCQGLSFLAATLLLHMPEEQAFCLLVRLMYGYGLRELYKDGFEELYMRLHQLDRLMEVQLPDLRAHFQQLGVEPHMFASQWFLTVFTARFPLPLVYHILDVFLLQGINTLFQVALALLTRSRRDLLQHDFEGVLKYFRVTLPKKCRSEEATSHVIKLACSIKVPQRRLQKYQQEYEKFVKEAAEKEKFNDELERLKTTNSQLQKEKETLETQLAESRASFEAARKETAHHAAVSRDYRDICARLDKQLHQIQDYANSCTACSVKIAQKDNKEASEEDKENSSDTEAQLRQRVRDLELELAQVKLALVEAQCSNQRVRDLELELAQVKLALVEAQCSNQVSLAQLRQRVRDLELELAQVKLALVEAQCSNQELSHQLNTALNEVQTAMNQKQTVAPWLVRTLGSIMEAAHNRPSFQTYLPAETPTQPLRRQGSFTGSQGPAGHAHANLDRRVSEPTDAVITRRRPEDPKRHSMVAETPRESREPKDNRRSHDGHSVG
ncbi:rab GTPase-activating protein 1-like [Leguminivora glycinivorella]|uniref:rab GTPase-activating protein 1-like n=1 Tax=Leguminivora glycinivorella TaxID=1035111 RepID=UPI00200C86FE|nr:rab GTPase-activating protein 1-like [Leguminivora glycinivorella]